MSTDSKFKHRQNEEEDDMEITIHEEPQNLDFTSNRTQKYIIDNANLLYNFVKITLELRELVKCPLW